MRNIGILTFQDADNYGAMLQCYALQKVINERYCTAEVINYKCYYLNHPYGFKSLKHKGLPRYILGNVNAIVRCFRHNNFEKFRKILPLTKPITRKNIKKATQKYDAVVVGSDCVWNDDITDFDKVYLLDFINDSKKKLSYAASFGSETISSYNLDQYKKLLSSFKELNVREKSGMKIINNLIHKEANVVLDPTLLLDRNDWDKIAKSQNIKGKYIFVYQLSTSKYLLSIVNILKKKTGLPAIFIPFPIGGFVKSKSLINKGPADLIGLIRDAEYVVTDSFHGTVFSIIYGKKFYSCANELATRLINILTLLDSKDHLFMVGDKFRDVNNSFYSHSMDLLNEQKENSLNILKNMLVE